MSRRRSASSSGRLQSVMDNSRASYIDLSSVQRRCSAPRPVLCFAPLRSEGQKLDACSADRPVPSRWPARMVREGARRRPAKGASGARPPAALSDLHTAQEYRCCSELRRGSRGLALGQGARHRCVERCCAHIPVPVATAQPLSSHPVSQCTHRAGEEILAPLVKFVHT